MKRKTTHLIKWLKYRVANYSVDTSITQVWIHKYFYPINLKSTKHYCAYWLNCSCAHTPYHFNYTCMTTTNIAHLKSFNEVFSTKTNIELHFSLCVALRVTPPKAIFVLIRYLIKMFVEEGETLKLLSSLLTQASLLFSLLVLSSILSLH